MTDTKLYQACNFLIKSDLFMLYCVKFLNGCIFSMFVRQFDWAGLCEKYLRKGFVCENNWRNMDKLKDFNPDKIKFTYMNADDFEISLDRLTRFKFTEKKYFRVFSEIITKHLITPKLSRQDIESLKTETMVRIVENIWNGSLKNHIKQLGTEKFLNELLKKEENDAFNLSEEMKKLAGANLNITDALKLFSEYKNLPLNLKRLNILQKERNEAPSVLREKYALKFPVEKVVLCEGITEEILLPGFAKIYGYDFNRFGVHLISAGGKNQVAKLYCELKEELKIPVFILLDADAKQISEVIASVLRQQDVIYLIKHGEFEDIFPLTLIRRTINNSFKNILKASVNDFKRDMPMTKTLADYYRENRLGDFQKADFAKQIYENLHSKKDLSDEIAAIVDMIAGL